MSKNELLMMMGAATRMFRAVRRCKLAYINFAVLLVMARRRAEGDNMPLSTGELADLLALKLNNAMKQLRYMEGKGLVRSIARERLQTVFPEHRWHPRYFYWHLTAKGGQLMLDILRDSGLNAGE